MDATAMLQHLATAMVARLATVGAGEHPHIVPICLALEGNTLYFAVDAKPKRTANLKRLRNIATNPAVAVLVDHYEDDWTQLWWVRADGSARVIDDHPESERVIDLLQKRYAQYRQARPQGPVVAISIERLSGWSAS